MRRLGRWVGRGVLAVERGDDFNDWTKRGSGVWEQRALDDYDHLICNFRNNAGADEGAAEWRKAYSTIGISNPTGYTASHTVHVRMSKSNRAGYVAIGPATALHASSGAGNGYCAIAAYPGSVSSVEIRKITNGTSLALVVAPYQVNEGDVVSLGYRFNTSASAAELFAMVNGVVVTSTSDLVSPYDMDTLAALPGLWGDFFPTIPASYEVGHYTNEWWVTDLAATYSEPQPRYPAGVGEILLQLMQRQRFTDSTTPLIQRLISGQVTSCSWTVNRLGGCGDFKVTFRYPHVRTNTAGSPSTYTEHRDYELFVHPIAGDWNASHWFGGDAILLVKWKPEDDGQTTTDTLWRGRVTRIGLDPSSKEITVEGEGLVQALDDIRIYESFVDAPISKGNDFSIIKRIVAELVSKSATHEGRDNPIRYNPSKIVGLQSVLETKLSIDFKGESALSAIQTVLSYMPDGIVWGVDREGDFYLDQQLDTYDNDMSGAGFVTYTVDKEAVRFDREIDFDRIRSVVTVVGREAEGSDGDEALEAGRITATAICDRARALWGTREELQSEGGIEDVGLLGKVALSRCKARCFPAHTGRLTVVQRITGQRSFYAALRRDAPRVGVIDRPQLDVAGRLPIGYVAPYTAGAIGTDGYAVGPYTLRRFGDVAAHAFQGVGTNSNGIELAVAAAEQALDRSWLVRSALRFDVAHPGATGDFAYLFGRCGGSTATNFGWGGLWWERTGASTGTLVWKYTNSLGTARTVATGISVPPAGSGLVVRITVHRDQFGDWRIYNGTSATATDATLRTDLLPNSGAPWRWFDHDSTGLPATHINADYVLDQWYVFSTFNSSGHSIEEQNLGLAGFLSRNDDRELRRCDGEGLLLYAPLKGPVGVTVPMQRENPSTLHQATVFGSGAATADPVTSTAVTGQLVTSDAATTKRWGGAMIFEVERCTYEVEPSAGIVRKSYTLGEPVRNSILTLATVKQQIRQLEDTQRRTERDF